MDNLSAKKLIFKGLKHFKDIQIQDIVIAKLMIALTALFS
jgi:hypothetical protein